MMKKLFSAAAYAQLMSSEAFVPASFSPRRIDISSTSLSAESDSTNLSRRNLLSNLSIASIVSFGVLSAYSPEPVYASGGATAGGAYLLSAKQRYNARVTAGVKGFGALESSLDGGRLDAAKAFFTTDDVGGWKDASAAGYLLSNAFRRSSTTPPDSLPTVKVRR